MTIYVLKDESRLNGNSDTSPEPPKGHVRFIVSCITVLSAVAFIGGTVLVFKGYHGDLLIGGGLAGISGLVGMLSSAKAVPVPVNFTVPPAIAPTISVSEPTKEEKTT